MLGKTIKIRGEVSGDEDLIIDGQLEGKIELTKGLTIGKNGEVHAQVQAQSVTVSGKLQGDVLASGRVEVESTATMVGNVTAPRVSIADGAYFNGAIEMTGRDGDGH